MTDPIGSGTPAVGGVYSGWAAGGAAPTAEDQTLGKDAFLKLLVAQLRYQDPSKPADAAQFMAETAQFTMVEKLDSLAAMNQQVLTTSQTQSAVSMIGGQVSWLDADGQTPISGVVSGVTLRGGVPVLQVGNFEVDLSAVTEVKSAPTASTV